MRKDELRKLERIHATPEMVRMAEDNAGEMTYKSRTGWGDRHRSTRYDAMVRSQVRGKILMTAVFFPECLQAGELTPAYEIYCDPEGGGYITRSLKGGEEKKWLTARADNLAGLYGSDALDPYVRMYYDGTEERIWQDTEGKETVKRSLGTKTSRGTICTFFTSVSRSLNSST